MPLAQTHDDPDRVIAALRAWGVRTGFGNERLKLGGVKVYLDGGASLGTALMREPWPDEKCQCGIQVTHTDLFHRLVETCASSGWSLGVHTVGGKAIDIALSVFEEVDRRYPIRDLRFSLIHAYLWPTEANIAAARRLNVCVATQASMQYQFAPLLVRRFGRDLGGKATPVKTWIDGGIVVGGGSDSPVTPYPPLLGMWHAVTRHVDALGGPLGADEAVSAEQALAMYTRGSAWLSFSEHERGMIRPGLLADWVSLSQDPLAIDPMALRDLKVDATAVGGEIVYRA
jgi:predicted amidohydrolase YtcJ